MASTATASLPCPVSTMTGSSFCVVQPGEELQAVHVGQPVVEQQAVGPLLLGHPQPLLAELRLQELVGVLRVLTQQAPVEHPGPRGCRRRSGCGRASRRSCRSHQLLGQDHDLEPVVVEALDGLHEAVQVHRLLDVAVGARAVAGLDVALVARGGEDDDRDLLQVGSALISESTSRPSVPGRLRSSRMTPGRGACAGRRSVPGGGESRAPRRRRRSGRSGS